MGKLTTITIQTTSLLILQSRDARWGWCPICGADREMIPVALSSTITDLSWPDLEASLLQYGMHRSQDRDGTPLLCINALLSRGKQSQPDARVVRRWADNEKEKR